MTSYDHLIKDNGNISLKLKDNLTKIKEIRELTDKLEKLSIEYEILDNINEDTCLHLFKTFYNNDEYNNKNYIISCSECNFYGKIPKYIIDIGDELLLNIMYDKIIRDNVIDEDDSDTEYDNKYIYNPKNYDIKTELYKKQNEIKYTYNNLFNIISKSYF